MTTDTGLLPVTGIPKSYGSNWISAGTGLWFLREAKYINNPRMQLGVSCLVSGTGFLMHKDIVKENGGWNFFLLTEDVQFSVNSILKGEKIGYCEDAIFYDEQPLRLPGIPGISGFAGPRAFIRYSPLTAAGCSGVFSGNTASSATTC